jgi:hypothetical protein
VELDLFAANTRHLELGIAARVARGFLAYAESQDLTLDLTEGRVPHPFDSHPPLLTRLDALGQRGIADQAPRLLAETPADSWLSAIDGAGETETRLWAAYELRFFAEHELTLAFRYLPSTVEEAEHVARSFPPLPFYSVDDGPLVLDHTGLRFVGSGERIAFHEVTSVQTKRRFLFQQSLILSRSPETDPMKLASRALPDTRSLGPTFTVELGAMKHERALFLRSFADYSARFRMAVAAHLAAADRAKSLHRTGSAPGTDPAAQTGLN